MLSRILFFILCLCCKYVKPINVLINGFIAKPSRYLFLAGPARQTNSSVSSFLGIVGLEYITGVENDSTS